MLHVDDRDTAPLPPPSDPWAGRAPVPGEPPRTEVMPEVIFVREPRKRRWPWVLGTFALLGILCCGLCAAFTAPIRAQYPSRVAAMPKEVAGLKRSDDPMVRTVAAAAADRFRLEPFIDDAFAHMLTDPKSGDRQVIVFGATLLILDPAKELKKAIQGAGETISSVTDYPPGPMGGELKCANGEDENSKAVTFCAWVDHGSVGVALCYGKRSMAQCSSILRTVREKIIIRP